MTLRQADAFVAFNARRDCHCRQRRRKFLIKSPPPTLLARPPSPTSQSRLVKSAAIAGVVHSVLLVVLQCVGSGAVELHNISSVMNHTLNVATACQSSVARSNSTLFPVLVPLRGKRSNGLCQNFCWAGLCWWLWRLLRMALKRASSGQHNEVPGSDLASLIPRKCSLP